MDSEILRRLIWAGLLAATGALATVAAHRLSEVIWRRVFNEEPPELPTAREQSRRRHLRPRRTPSARSRT